MIDLSTFSLGKQRVTVERYTGSYTGGVFTRTLESTFDMWASVQPYSTVEQDEIIDPATGNWVEEIRQMFCTDKLYLNNRKNPENQVGDIVIVDGEKWEPLKIEVWQHLENRHYLVLLKRHDGE